MSFSWDFRINADGNQAMSVLGQMENKLKSLGDTARNELGQKLKSVFTTVAIEEAVRRTSDWAQSIQAASKELGVSNEMLQTLQVMGTKAGLSADTYVTAFQNVTKAIDGAVNGNQELINSFGRLGIAIDRTGGTSYAKYFSQVMGAIPHDINAPGAVGGDLMMKRGALQAITGTAPNILATAQTATNGNFEEYQKQQTAGGSVQTNESVAQLSATWTEFKQTFTDLGHQLTPVVTFVVGLLNTLGKALAGVVDYVKSIFSGNVKEVAAATANAGFGLVKSVTQATDWVGRKILKFSGREDLAKKGALTELLEKPQDWLNKKLGTTTQAKERAEALGMVAPAFFGDEAGVAGAIKTGGSKVAKAVIPKEIVEKLSEAKRLATTKTVEADTDRYVADTSRTMDLYREQGSMYNAEYMDLANKVAKARMAAGALKMARYKKQYGKSYFAHLVADETSGGLLAGSSIALKKQALDYDRTGNLGNKLVSGANAGLTGVAVINAAAKGMIPGTQGEDTSPIYGGAGAFISQMGAKPSMLSMGNTFGSGFQSRIIQLNQQMVQYLAQITKYMNPINQTTYPANANDRPAGGN